MNSNSATIIHTIIAILSLLVGYPYFGSFFVLLMIPYIAIMTLKKDAHYFPAIAVHCFAGTTSMLSFYVSCLLLGFINYKELKNRGMSIMLWIFSIIFCIVVIYVFLRRPFYDNIQSTIISFQFCFSFFAFIYGVIVFKSFDTYVVKQFIYVFLLLYFIALIDSTYLSTYNSMIVIFLVSAAFSSVLFIQSKSTILLFISGLTVLLMIFMRGGKTTFTLLLSIFYSFLLSMCYFRKQKRLLKLLTNVFPYFIIIVFVFFGIFNYSSINISWNDVEETNLNDFSLLIDRAKFKIIDDRAPYWNGAWEQIITSDNYLPPVVVQGITAYTTSGNEILDVTFGGHNTYLELLRLFGWIVGSTLCISYILISVLAGKIFLLNKLNKTMVLFFSSVIAQQVIVSLTGTYVMLGNCGVFQFSLLGIMYSIYCENKRMMMKYNLISNN